MLQATNRSVSPISDALEFARGAFSALSFSTPETAQEIHVTKLHEYFRRAKAADHMASALADLRFLREAEPLGGGSWIAAPTRTVELDSERCMLVGAAPTVELRRHFKSARRAGAGRVVKLEEAASLTRQSLETWMGGDGSDARTWARTTITSALMHLAPSLEADGMEVFGLREGRRGATPRLEPVWIRPDTDIACNWRGVGLFRAKTGAAKYRHFLGRLQRGSGFLEGSEVQQPLRMQFGLAALLDRPLTIKLESSLGGLSMSLPLAAPSNLRRLLFALCEAEPKSFGRVWTCRDGALLQILTRALTELQCETVRHD